jgi:hypothetical protein
MRYNIPETSILVCLKDHGNLEKDHAYNFRHCVFFNPSDPVAIMETLIELSDLDDAIDTTTYITPSEVEKLIKNKALAYIHDLPEEEQFHLSLRWNIHMDKPK